MSSKMDVGGGLRHFGVFLVEHGGVDLAHGFGDFLSAGPDVAQVYQDAVVVVAQGVAADVGAHGAGHCVGDDQQRRGEPVGFYQRVHAAFEVAVAREDQAIPPTLGR